MFEEYSWKKLEGDISFKMQNYTNSCFAAAYQNLCANLNLSYRSVFTGSYYDVEKQEADYMSRRYGCDIAKKSPNVTHIDSFLNDEIDKPGYSNSAINFRVNTNILLGTGQPPDYRTGYILNTGNGPSQHACAFFVKKIKEVDYYIYLDSKYDYLPRDFINYALPCDMGMKALEGFCLYDNLIQGGAIVLF